MTQLTFLCFTGDYGGPKGRLPPEVSRQTAILSAALAMGFRHQEPEFARLPYGGTNDGSSNSVDTALSPLRAGLTLLCSPCEIVFPYM